jgi:hypothetical protein
MSSDEHDVGVILLRYPALELQSIDVRELHVQHQASRDVRLRIRQVFGGRTERHRVHIEAGQELDERLADPAVVVNDEDDVVLRHRRDGTSEAATTHSQMPAPGRWSEQAAWPGIDLHPTHRHQHPSNERRHRSTPSSNRLLPLWRLARCCSQRMRWPMATPRSVPTRRQAPIRGRSTVPPARRTARVSPPA